MRQVCSHCHLPIKSCLCSWVRPLSRSYDWGVLQDPSESLHPKNSLRLLSLSWSELRVWQERDIAQVPELKDWLVSDEPIYLVFPTNKACLSREALPEAVTLHHLVNKTKRPRLLFIDATWRKATKLILSNPDLARLTRLVLFCPEKSNYIIRKGPGPTSLSTFEAIMVCLEAFEVGLNQNDDMANAPRFDALWQSYQDWQQSLLAFNPRNAQ